MVMDLEEDIIMEVEPKPAVALKRAASPIAEPSAKKQRQDPSEDSEVIAL
jgi:hypothetical protein